MNAPVSFDRTRFSYLKIERVEQEHKSRGELAREGFGSLEEAEEFPDDSSTFTLFAELPLELQRRIWHFAALVPRIVEVHEVQLYAWVAEASEPGSSKSISPRCSQITHFRSRTGDPPLLRTCRESREAALPKYKRTDLANEYCADSIYFEYDYDTMYLSQNTMKAWYSRWMAHPYIYRTQYPPTTSLRGQTMCGEVRSLAFDAELLVHRSIHSAPSQSWMVPHQYVCKQLADQLLVFQHLEEVIIVFNENYMTTGDGRLSSIRFHEPNSGSGIAALLQEVANLLDKELQKRVRAREAQAVHVLENICRNLGGIPCLDPMAFESKLKPPVVRTMVTRLSPTSSIGSDTGGGRFSSVDPSRCRWPKTCLEEEIVSDVFTRGFYSV